MNAGYEPTERTRVRRKPGRGSYDAELIHSILDEALICHVGFVADGQPYVIPTIHARDGETLYLHGSPASRTLNALGDGTPCCVTVTLVDELVLARSAKQHSLNYRSAMVLGTARQVRDEDEKRAALRTVVEHIASGRAAEIRGPSAKELATTEVVAVPIEEASAKVRTGPPADKPGDVDPRVWAGLLPVELSAGEPVPGEDVEDGLPVPEHLKDWRRG